MKICFEEKNFRTPTLHLIQLCNAILDEYADQGLVLTVRQLYYQLVARGHIENTIQSYKRLGKAVSNGRLAGLIDWNMIEDRARQVIFPGHWKDPAEIVDSAYYSFRVDRWENQPKHVEVMVEKDALAGVLEGVCRDLDVRLIPNRGYTSQSMMFKHGQRIDKAEQDGKEVHIIYLGDHDPSGLDMDRDIEERAELFSYGVYLHFLRLALTMEQIEQYNPPPDPAKLTDSRAGPYIRRYGRHSWELDALEPSVLVRLVRDEVESLRDPDLYAETMERERAMKAELKHFVDEYKARG